MIPQLLEQPVGTVLNLRELSHQKEDAKEFFAIKLGEENALIYRHLATGFKPIVVNSIQQLTSNGKVPSHEQFIRSVDNNLSLILKAWRLPVVVWGNKHAISVFKSITANEAHILKCVSTPETTPGNYFSERFVMPLLADWEALKEKYYLKQLEKAIEENRADVGIDDVWNASIHKRNDLLLLEEGFTYPSYNASADCMGYADAIPMNTSGCAYDAVEKVVERVLAGGGEVAIVPKGLFREHLHIAVLMY